MKKIILILIILLNSTFANSQKYSSIINDKEIYNFLNWLTNNKNNHSKECFFKRKKVPNKILSWSIENFIANDSTLINQHFNSENKYLFYQENNLDTIFNKQDREYLFNQFKSIKDSIWHERFPKSKLTEKLKERENKIRYYSIPLFSSDKNFVLIFQIYFCGNECEYGGYYVYKKINSKKWKLIKSINTWIS